MNPTEFVRKWSGDAGRERGSAQAHFIDICRLIGEPTPQEGDPSGNFYAFEAGARWQEGRGFADVWHRGKFAWEYKSRGGDLRSAYGQVNRYREALGNPPLLAVTNFEYFEVHTNWTNTEKWVYSFPLEAIASDDPVAVNTVSGDAEGAPKLTALRVLKLMFEDPDALKPNKTREQITAEAAGLFGQITKNLRKWEVEDMRIARFVTRSLFCMFASDIGLLPRDTFSAVLDTPLENNPAFRRTLAALFDTMDRGGEFGPYPIRHFNGRLFENSEVPDQITTEHILILKKLNDLNWADVEPAIFGTFFERIIDPAQRKKLGAHYTSAADIELIVEPVVMEPLRREWEDVKAQAEKYLYDSGIRS
jgi:hypothetical protein